MTRSLLVATFVGIVAGTLFWAAGAGGAADTAWAATAAAAFIPTVAVMIRDAIRHRAGIDVIAVIAIAGALVLGEYLTGAVIGLMLASGRALDEFAANRAERELSSLLRRAPRVAHRLVDGVLTTVPIDQVLVADTLVVKEGDIVPVDGVVVEGVAVLDESALTGESRPVERPPGDPVRSGVLNGGASFRIRATAAAADSTYAGIVRMVGQAQASKAPLVRLADRYARVFVPVTLVLAIGAGLAAGSATRALAVLVVATPCPLLLGAPVAIVSGVSRAAKRGIVVKGGAAIETLARAKALYLDKTGTLTMGAPRLERVLFARDGVTENELVRLAASLDQMSSHVFAAALVRAARARDLTLTLPTETRELAGAGIEGSVGGRSIRVGSFNWASPSSDEHLQRFRRRVMRDGGSVIFVAVEGELAGAFVFDDPIRAEAPRIVRTVKRLGVEHVVMLTGDHAAVAEAVGVALGVDQVLSGLSPEDKVEAVRASKAERVTVMAGDGINDAPALAAADVGVAMGARGATSSSEAADIVLTVDRLDRLAEAIRIAQRSRAIAVQSMAVGMGLSFVAMVAAAFGLLPPVAGAFLQEGIDAAAILNALRALGSGRDRDIQPSLPPELTAELRREHGRLLPEVERLRSLADEMGELGPERLAARLNDARGIVAVILEHEREDETDLYRRIARALPGEDPLAAMSRTHREIFHLGRSFERLAADLGVDGAEPEDRVDLRRTLYALHAIITLNIAQEEELYASLDRDFVEPAR